MQTRPQKGYLVIADISGYTSYIATTELEHAHDILSDLIELVVNRFTPVLSISRLEGDAVCAYAPGSSIARGETLLELIETTYFAFRDRQDAMRHGTTCECNACKSIPSLDLKFIVHYGDYLIQNMAGVQDLIGSDVNLLHRLSKNHISEATGWRGYALFTRQCVEQLNLQLDGAFSQAESYEHLGEVLTYSINLQTRYQELLEQRKIMVTPEDAHYTVTHDYKAPPYIVWEWLTDQNLRNLCMDPYGMHFSPGIRPKGRTGIGARNHCAHGKNQQSIETVVDWKPFDYYTVESPVSGKMKLMMTYTLTPTEQGTHMEWLVKLEMPRMPEFLKKPICVMMMRMFKMPEKFDRYEILITEDLARRNGTTAEAVAAV